MVADIKRTIRRYILENMLFTDDESALADRTSFLATGMIDSTAVLEIVYFIEDTFGVTVEDEEMVPENLDSIDILVAYVTRKQAPVEA